MAHAHIVHADLQDVTYDTIRQVMLKQVAAYDFPVLADTDHELRIRSPLGEVGVTTPRGNRLRLHVSAQNKEDLFMIRDAVVQHIALAQPALADTLAWSDTLLEGATPPNFQFAEVRSRTELGQDFYRVVIRPEHPERFDDSSIHFRFVLPSAENVEPEWPRLQANGSTKWPTGSKELHRPVYTMRNLNYETGEAVVDVFRHDGGRTMGWAQTVSVGDTVAMIGPGGGGVLQSSNVILCGDETAYPAIARILENLPKDAIAQVFMINHSGACDYPLPYCPGASVEWVTGDAIQKVGDRILSTYRPETGQHLWLAAEASVVAPVRTATKTKDKSLPKPRISNFWTDKTKNPL